MGECDLDHTRLEVAGVTRRPEQVESESDRAAHGEAQRPRHPWRGPAAKLAADVDYSPALQRALRRSAAGSRLMGAKQRIVRTRRAAVAGYGPRCERIMTPSRSHVRFEGR
jgi:hypothetical protein